MDPTRYKFFFVCGHSRSGTTWLEKVLDLHPRLNCVGEFHLEVVRRGFDEFVGRRWHLAHAEPMRSIAEECFAETVRRCLESVASRKPGADWIGDRTPRPLRPLLPGSPHIVMSRDGRDVAISYMIHQMRTNGLDVRREPFRTMLAEDLRALRDDPAVFESDPPRLLRHPEWVRHVARKWGVRCRRDLDTVDRLAQTPERGRATVVRYEMLRAEPDAERSRLYRFLGVSPDEAAPLSPEEGTSAGLAMHDPGGKARKGIVGDWKNFAVGRAGRRFRRIFKPEAGDVLIRLGYESDASW